MATHCYTWVFSGCGEESKASESWIFSGVTPRHPLCFLDFAALEIGGREAGAEQSPSGNPKIVVVEGCVAVGANAQPDVSLSKSTDRS